MELLTNTTTTFISTLVNKKSKADPHFMDKEIAYIHMGLIIYADHQNNTQK